LSDSAVPSNRIEVMARAIGVISALRNVNRCLKEKLSTDGNDHRRSEPQQQQHQSPPIRNSDVEVDRKRTRNDDEHDADEDDDGESR